ncbi:transcription factor Cys6 [Metarhizium robertsii ARSEF 23]|uniref:Transcription factor Cys6 n=1 Tax=Metarhizium robertsii (strain ARSEF 23 / ATCC MYA-3075) TaxID=655844 RepID=A0A0B2XG11_METRA|nr:transcription factor Cys6 [Metarhizium robertsii ARSEF 23]KHO10954.1 transcription factor Cys6 [Metarhizium robertsii ARSEF 23]
MQRRPALRLYSSSARKFSALVAGRVPGIASDEVRGAGSISARSTAPSGPPIPAYCLTSRALTGLCAASWHEKDAIELLGAFAARRVKRPGS